VIADRDYSARGHRADLHRRGITAVIPEPADQAAHRRRRGSAGGRPVGYDRAAYRGRNVIKRTFNQLKASRGIAARYDKHATVFHGALVLVSILIWLRHQETRPSHLSSADPRRACPGIRNRSTTRRIGGSPPTRAQQ
jgi:transposase